MDWDTYQRARASLTFVFLVFVSILFLVFQQRSPVRWLRASLGVFSHPLEKLFVRSVPLPNSAAFPSTPAYPIDRASNVSNVPLPYWAWRAQTLETEVSQLQKTLQLKKEFWPHAIAAHVVGRDPNTWFEEILLNKGSEHGVVIGQPVVAIATEAAVLIGRVTEVDPAGCKVMLLNDGLSAVPAQIKQRSVDDGVLEGDHSPTLWLRYLHRESLVRVGDEVVTSGLGAQIPAGLLIGSVEDVMLDPRQLFLQARIRPAIVSSALRVVLILKRPGDPV